MYPALGHNTVVGGGGGENKARTKGPFTFHFNNKTLFYIHHINIYMYVSVQYYFITENHFNKSQVTHKVKLSHFIRKRTILSLH